MDALFSAVCGPSPSGCDTAGIWLGALLTLLVFSFLLRDTFLFRLAQSLLVGAAIGYGSAVILRNVLWDQLLVPLINDSSSFWAHTWPLAAIPLLLGGLLLTKLAPNWSGATLGNWGLGYLFGVGAALAIYGALNSVLTQQVGATIVSLSPTVGLANWMNNLLILVGTLGALLSFRFTIVEGNRVLQVYGRIANVWSVIGRAFIMVAFGAILANVLAARISVLVGQLYFLFHDWLGIVK